ncbi:MAG: endopeptidase La [Anaerolineaceae bacterium]|nr:endopeptidase La [Anaerolineaceae bacterium]
MSSTIIQFDQIPDATPDDNGFIELPVVVLSSQVVFPNTLIPLTPQGERGQAAIQYSLDNNTTLISVLARRHDSDADLIHQFHDIGTEIAVQPMPLRQLRALIPNTLAQGRQRVRILEMVQTEPYLVARAQIVADACTVDEEELSNIVDTALEMFDQLASLNMFISDEVGDLIEQIDDPSELCDLVGSTLDITVDERQELLELDNLAARYERLIQLLANQISVQEVREEVNSAVHGEMARIQREAYLREQMRVIQSELGDEEYAQADIEQLHHSVLAANMPQEVQDKALTELKRLATMPSIAPEASVIRSYVEWLADLPWQSNTRDNLNLNHAEKVLEEAHFGLDKVKDRIVEHIAVRKMAKEKMNTPILCFVGPPGVGKTSLGRSIAKALGREFVRISLGGVRDEAEIRGHRRTYIGALPGRIIQTMKRAGTNNPVFMLDEIDKLSTDYRGDPASALLEVLDPEQNNEFSDHYLEVPYDLSKVFFITTANDLYPLPEALEDRMEVIEFRAYTEEEKLEIAKRFLIPKQLVANGITKYGIQFQNDALMTIIHHYTLEAGVRNLEREIGNVCRKITRLVATKRKYPKRITAQLVEKYLGPPPILDARINKEDLIGLSTGLVWTSHGGDFQLIEVSLLPGKGSLTLTGQLGDVLQESAQTALSYMRSRASEWDVPHDDFDNYDIHIHMPEGAVPKDGPSAGITLAVAIISAFTERKVRHDFCMTGEITLRGHVLPVGGIKEKVLAARRNRIPNVILPADNKKDLPDIPKQALKDLNIHFVEHMQDVLDLVLLDAPEQRQRDIENQNSGSGNDEDQNNE